MKPCTTTTLKLSERRESKDPPIMATIPRMETISSSDMRLLRTDMRWWIEWAKVASVLS